MYVRPVFATPESIQNPCINKNWYLTCIYDLYGTLCVSGPKNKIEKKKNKTEKVGQVYIMSDWALKLKWFE